MHAINYRTRIAAIGSLTSMLWAVLIVPLTAIL